MKFEAPSLKHQLSSIKLEIDQAWLGHHRPARALVLSGWQIAYRPSAAMSLIHNAGLVDLQPFGGFFHIATGLKVRRFFT